MANAIQWQAAPTSRGTVLTTEMNALAAAARTNSGTEIDNSVNLDMYGWLELSVTFGTAPAASGFVSIYIVRALGGTNYEDGSSTVDPGGHTWVASIPVRAVNTIQRLMVGPIQLPPSKIEFIVANNASQAFSASGHTLTLYTDNAEVQ